jgi:hypothetical protein
MPGKEVGHDKKRSMVVPMGVSLSELSGKVTGNCPGQLRCIAGEQLEAPSSPSRRLPRRGNDGSVVS